MYHSVYWAVNLQAINTTAGIHQDSVRAWQPRQPLRKSLLVLTTCFFFPTKWITNFFLIFGVTPNALERIQSCLKLYSHYKQAVNVRLLGKLIVTQCEQRSTEKQLSKTFVHVLELFNAFHTQQVLWTSLVLKVISLVPRQTTHPSCRTFRGIMQVANSNPSNHMIVLTFSWSYKCDSCKSCSVRLQAKANFCTMG